MREQERMQVLKVVTLMVLRCEGMIPKFASGTPQHTLLKRRIQALKMGETLLSGGDASAYTNVDFSAALEPLASIVRKCEKARSKYEPGSGQYSRYYGILQAMEVSQALIEDEMDRRRGYGEKDGTLPRNL